MIGVPLALLVSRLLQIHGGEIEITLAVLAALLFGIPQICLWTIRKRKYLLCGFIAAAVVLDAVAVYAHFAYCRWSVKNVARLYGQSITVEKLYRDCGKPLLYRHVEKGEYALYGDGSSEYWVYLDGSGIIKQMPMGSLWGD